MLVSVTRLREGFVNGIPLSLKQAISAGVGLFIALIALQQAGWWWPTRIRWWAWGFATSRRRCWRCRLCPDCHPGALACAGAILLGILAITALSAALGLSEFNGVFAAPPSLAPTSLQLDVAGARWRRGVERGAGLLLGLTDR